MNKEKKEEILNKYPAYSMNWLAKNLNVNRHKVKKVLTDNNVIIISHKESMRNWAQKHFHDQVKENQIGV